MLYLGAVALSKSNICSVTPYFLNNCLNYIALIIGIISVLFCRINITIVKYIFTFYKKHMQGDLAMKPTYS
jgi:hypothetical protein